MLKQILVFAACFFCLAQADNLPAFKAKWQKDAKGLRFEFFPPSGYAFNLEAPSKVRGRPLVKFEKSENLFVWLDPESRALQEPQIVELYVCDLKKTFCVKQIQEMRIDSGELKLNDWGHRERIMNPQATEVQEGPLGFILNDPERALRQAKKEKKNLLIVFSGIWCPPCNQLEEEVYPDPEFLSATQSWVKLKLDADSDVSWDLKKKYLIGPYPTLIAANSEGGELGRIVGFVPSLRLVKWMNDVTTSVHPKIRKARWHFDRKEYSAAQSVLERLRDQDAEVFKGEGPILLDRVQIEWLKQQWETQAEKKDEIAAQRKAILKIAIGRHFGTTDSLEWAYELAGLSKEGHEMVIQIARVLLETEPQKQVGSSFYSKADLFAWIGESLNAIGKKKEGMKSFLEAAREYEEQIKKLNTQGKRLQLNRGLNLQRAWALSEGGKSTEAEKIYRELQIAYPEEFTFYYAHAALLRREKRNIKEAERLIRRALPYAYGDNRLRSIELLVGVLAEKGKRKEAKQIGEEELKKVKLPEDPSNRTHRYYRKLKESVEGIKI